MQIGNCDVVDCAFGSRSRGAAAGIDATATDCCRRSAASRACQTHATTDQSNWLTKARESECLYECTVDVSARKAKIAPSHQRKRSRSRDARIAHVEVRATTLTLRPPWRHDRKLPTLTVNVVLAEETNPPDGCEAIQWLLITTLPIDQPEQVKRIVQAYCIRWHVDQCHRDLDVVLIATPDHHRAPAAIRAVHLGKHVFAQKPLAHNIYECYALGKAAREKKVCTQMGNQGYCGDGIRRVAEYIAAGAIGKVLESHTILGRNFGGSGGRPESKPVRAGLHWDEWIGPAPYRDYHDGLHPFSWRSWRQFGTGTIGDMACHHVAVPFMALRLWEVKGFTIECIQTTGGSEGMYPQSNIVCYHIPARDQFAACKCYVYDHGDLKPEVMKEAEKKAGRPFGEFTLFVGDKGMIGSDARLIPPSEHDKSPPPEPTLPPAHTADRSTTCTGASATAERPHRTSPTRPHR